MDKSYINKTKRSSNICILVFLYPIEGDYCDNTWRIYDLKYPCIKDVV